MDLNDCKLTLEMFLAAYPYLLPAYLTPLRKWYRVVNNIDQPEAGESPHSLFTEANDVFKSNYTMKGGDFYPLSIEAKELFQKNNRPWAQ